MKEAEALVDQYKKYIHIWPENWDSDSRICIMSSSANQVI